MKEVVSKFSICKFFLCHQCHECIIHVYMLISCYRSLVVGCMLISVFYLQLDSSFLRYLWFHQNFMNKWTIKYHWMIVRSRIIFTYTYYQIKRNRKFWNNIYSHLNDHPFHLRCVLSMVKNLKIWKVHWFIFIIHIFTNKCFRLLLILEFKLYFMHMDL